MTAPGRPGSALVIGEALVDIVIHSEQEPVDIPDGTPASVAPGLTRLGHGVELHCQIGTDERGQVVCFHLGASGAHLAPGASGAARTSTAQAMIEEDRAASYVFDLNWNPSRPTLPDEQASLLMHTDSIAAILAPDATTAEQVLRETRATSTIAYDLNARPQLMGDPKDARKIVEHLMDLSDLTKCSDEGIAWLYGWDVDLETVLRPWLSKGVAVVVATRDREGVLTLSTSGVRLEVPADPSAAVVDTMGAGDSFIGGLEDTLRSEDPVGVDRREALRAVGAETLKRITRHVTAIADITVPRARADPSTRDEPP